MKKLIRQILKEEVEQVSLSKILTKLKKIYPKLDYCVSEDGNRIKIWTFYMSSFEDMGADPEHPEEFTESGVWMELNDNSGGMDVGTFNDFRDNDGTYYDSDIDRLVVNISLSSSPQSILTTLIGVLDDELSVESGITGAATKNYEGRPDGESGFDWRKC
jgi:hypothetical protein